MSKKVTRRKPFGSSDEIVLLSFPDYCTLCHSKVMPSFVAATLCKDHTEVIFQCTNSQCLRTFIAQYQAPPKTGAYVLRKTVGPHNPTEEKFDKRVSELSPVFVQIYNQALASEALNLDQLTGIGLRKALEFLVKDFAISEKPSAADDIRKSPLGTCINNYIDQTNIKECAKRAVWLGNDATHYVRKWEDKDIEDLKVLIRLTVIWIENVLLTKHYLSDMT